MKETSIMCCSLQMIESKAHCILLAVKEMYLW